MSSRRDAVPFDPRHLEKPKDQAANASATAVVAGATGLVGQALVRQLAADGGWREVRALTRRVPAGPADAGVVPVQVDYSRLDPPPTWAAAEHVFCALGTTMRQAGSREAFRRVDFDYPMAVARATLARGARHFLLVSAVGASTDSRFFYNRVKGEVEAAITREVIALIEERGEPMAGAAAVIDMIRSTGLKIGLASSSSSEIIAAVLGRLGFSEVFDVTQSAEHEPYGKPHPAVYIECARRLGVNPERCVAIEDSPAGVLAAKAARMTCIAVPAPELAGDNRYCIADRRLASLTEFRPEMINPAP